MKLSSKESLVLAAAELRALAPAAVLRKETGLRDHTVRHALNRLKQRGICATVPFINLHRLGYTTINLFFTVSAAKRSTHLALLKAFQETPEVVWVGEFGGEYQYGIAICTLHFSKALETIASLSARFHSLLFAKAVSIQFGFSVYARRYLSPRKMKAPPVRGRVGGEIVEIDETDRAVLTTLATPGDRSHRDIAKALGMPASTVDLRVKRLTEKGVVAGYILGIDCTKYQYQAYKLLIYSRGSNPKISAQLQAFCERSANATYLIECLGEWDYEMGLEVGSHEEVSRIMQEIFEEFGSELNTIKVLSKFRDLKLRWFPGTD